jgi:hypothetical protein
VKIEAAIKTTVACGILGPLIGVFVFAGPLLFVNLGHSDFMFFIFMAYVMGALPALSVGVMLSVVGWYLRHLPFWSAIASGAIAFFGLIVVGYLFSGSKYTNSDLGGLVNIINILNVNILSAKCQTTSVLRIHHSLTKSYVSFF